ncbi:chondroitinase family polysaccharide lyase [Bacteroides sedimenti]|uniref:Chondroitin sulfate ABC exolyase n=1 Tax=Bacteroides sedimenti TaxID=2136147 RepID=A0ABN6Z027_9BACE
MKNKFIYPLILTLLFGAKTSLFGAVISFEDNTVPAGWSAEKGSLAVSTVKAKLGNYSLRWNWQAGDAMNAVNADGLAAASTLKGGGISVWVYNSAATNQPAVFSFYNSSNQKKCEISFNLNFRGWRCLWADFGRDMGHDLTALTTMKVSAPASGSGTLYFDFLEFRAISWEKMSDFQYKVNLYDGINDYLAIRNTPPAAPVTPTDEERNAFGLIKERMDKWYLGDGTNSSDASYAKRLNAVKSYVKTGVTNFGRNITLTQAEDGTVNGPGLFPMDYHGTTVDGVALTSFRGVNENYLLQLAYDFRMNGTTASRDNLLKAYDWYYDQGWADGSALGTLRFEMLRSAGFFHSAFLMRDQLTDEQFKRIFDSFNWYTLFGTVYKDTQNDGELADYIRTLAYPKLCYALTLKDEAQRTAAMKAFQGYMDHALKTAPGFLGTLKPDGSGYHHHAPYYSAYYPDVLYAGCLLYYMLHDTPFALSQESYQNLKKALLTFRFFSGEYNVPVATCGRFPNQTDVLQQLLPAFAYLILSEDTPDTELLGAYKRLWNPDQALVNAYISKARTDICYSNSLGEMDALIEASNLNAAAAESNPVGTKFLPFSGLLVVRQNDWMVTVKGFSKYIWDFEASTTENIYGRYLSYGQTEYSDLKNHYRSYDGSNANWDWRQLPGTTAKALSTTSLDFNKVGKHRCFSDSPFLGGIGFDDRCAVFSNRLHDITFDKSFYADKSVFVFGNALYCMGSGINSSSTTVQFNTTLFQNRLDVNASPFYLNGNEITGDVSSVSGNPVIKDNFGNAFIVNEGLTDIKKNATYCMAYINHGKILSDGKYAYTWLIGADDNLINNYKNSSPIILLKQDNTAHAVYHAGEKVLAASLFRGYTVVDAREIHQANKPLIVMMKEKEGGMYEVAITNPDMDREIPFAATNDNVTDAMAAVPGTASTITLELNGTFEKADGNSGVSVTSSKGITTLSYDSSKDGETYRVVLKSLTSGINNLQNSQAIVSTVGNRVVVSFPDSCEHSVELIQSDGTLLASKQEASAVSTLDMADCGKGVYMVRVMTGGKTLMFKVLR